MALALLPSLKTAHVHLRFLPSWRNPAVATMLRLSGWTVGYVVANQIALFVVTVLANGTSGGPFVYISAYAFFQLPHGLFAVSLMTTYTPELSSAAARHDIRALRAQLSRGLRLATVIVVPAAALYIGLARPIIVALLQRGAFSGADASLVSDTLVAFAVGLLPFSLYLFALRAFYARHDTFTPFWINCIENAINIVLAFPLYALFGIPGLALAFSLAYFGAAGITLRVLHDRLHGVDAYRIIRTIVRVCIAGLFVVLVSWVLSKTIGWASTLHAIAAVVVGTIVGCAVYYALLSVMHVEEMQSLMALVPVRRRRPPRGSRVEQSPLVRETRRP
jgi:putative peptidoglycan lipid II flippase